MLAQSNLRNHSNHRLPTAEPSFSHLSLQLEPCAYHTFPHHSLCQLSCLSFSPNSESYSGSYKYRTRCLCALWRWVLVPCRCRLPLPDAWLRNLGAGAAAGCCYQVFAVCASWILHARVAAMLLPTNILLSVVC